MSESLWRSRIGESGRVCGRLYYPERNASTCSSQVLSCSSCSKCETSTLYRICRLLNKPYKTIQAARSLRHSPNYWRSWPLKVWPTILPRLPTANYLGQRSTDRLLHGRVSTWASGYVDYDQQNEGRQGTSSRDLVSVSLRGRMSPQFAACPTTPSDLFAKLLKGLRDVKQAEIVKCAYTFEGLYYTPVRLG